MKLPLIIRHLRLSLTALLLCGACLASMQAAPLPASPKWEQTADPPAAQNEEIAVEVRGGYLYVRMAKAGRVELYTILGQPVAKATLPAGGSRIKLEARGIYILKAGSLTKRITA